MGSFPSCALPNLVDFVEAKGSNHHINTDNYILVQETNDPRFGPIRLMKSRSIDHSMYIKERELNYSMSQLEEIKFRSQLQNEHILDVFGFKKADDNDNRVQIFFEAFQSDLEKEIQATIASKASFSEEKLNVLLYCVLNALSYLQENNISHDCITPTNILRMANGYKLHDNFMIADNALLYNQALKGQNLRYLAPELLPHIAERDPIPNYNSFKADIYSLGICLLDAGVLNYGEIALVDRKGMKIIVESLSKRMKRLRELFSPQLCDVVEEMVRIDPTKRPDAITLYNRMPSKIREGKRRIFTPIGTSPVNVRRQNLFQAKGIQDEPVKRMRSESLKQKPIAVVHHKKSIDAKESVARNNETAIHKNRGLDPPDRRRDIERASGHKEVAKGRRQEEEDDNDVDISKIKISESIKNDPVLSRLVKKMYKKTGSKNSSPSISERNKSNLADLYGQLTAMGKTFTFMPNNIEEPAQKMENKPREFILAQEKYDPYSNINTFGNNWANDKVSRSLANNFQPEPLRSPYAFENDFFASLKYEKYNWEELGMSVMNTSKKGSVDNHHSFNEECNSGRFARPTELAQEQIHTNYFSRSQKDFRNFNESYDYSLRPYFSPDKYRDNQNNHELESKVVSSTKASEWNDIDARVSQALHRTRENIEKTKKTGSFTTYNYPQTASKVSVVRNTENSIHSSFSYPEKLIHANYYSAGKGTSLIKNYNTVPFTTESHTKNFDDYNKLNSDELSRLVAEIKKEYQPKLVEIPLQQSQDPSSIKLQYDFETKINPKPESQQLEGNTEKVSTKEEEKEMHPEELFNQYKHHKSSLNPSDDSDDKTFEAQILHLKKDIKDYFSQMGTESSSNGK